MACGLLTESKNVTKKQANKGCVRSSSTPKLHPGRVLLPSASFYRRPLFRLNGIILSLCF